MTFLCDFQIKEKIINEKLVENYIDLMIQLQPNSFEFTIHKIYNIEGTPIIGFDNKNRVLCNYKELKFDNNYIKLDYGIYKILFNEIVNIPNNIFAIGFPRSSLIRVGCDIKTTIWDSGFSGKSEALLIVNNKNGLILQKNARILQLLFCELSTSVKKGYDGIYNKLI